MVKEVFFDEEMVMVEVPAEARMGQMSDEKQQECVSLFYGPNGGGALDSRSAHKALWNYASLGRRFGIFRSHARLICLGQIKKSIYLSQAQMADMRSLYFGPEGQGGRATQHDGETRWTYRNLARRYGVTTSAIDACLNRGRFSPRRHLSSAQRQRKVWQPGFDDAEALMQALDAQAKEAGWHTPPPAAPARRGPGRARKVVAHRTAVQSNEGALAACT